MFPRLALFVLGVTLALSNLRCSVNILSTFADKTSDEALYYDALSDVNAHSWSAALTKISQMSTAYQATPQVIRVKASAYGGECGLDFLTFVQQLANMGSTRLFPFLLASFDASSSTDVDACMNAANTLQTISSVTTPTDDDWFQLAVYEFAKIGQILSYYADKTKAGTATTGFDACLVGTTRTNPAAGNEITDGDAREIGTGMTIAMQGLTKVAGKVSTGSGTVTTISGVCSALPAGYNFCTITDPTAFTANEVKGIRSLVKESNAIGLGANCTGDVTTCNCP